MLDFNIEFKGKGLVLRQLEKLKDGLERRKVLGAIAEEAWSLIKTRTLAGDDENDRALIPSRRVKLHGGQTLNDQGHMLGALKVLSLSSDRAVIGFGSALENKKAWWAQDGTKTKKGGVKSPKRPFFGVSPKDARELTTYANRLLAEALAAAEATR